MWRRVGRDGRGRWKGGGYSGREMESVAEDSRRRDGKL